MTRNTTHLTPKHSGHFTDDQKLQNLAKLKRRYLEKQADRKMKGNQKIMLLNQQTHFNYQSFVF